MGKTKTENAIIITSVILCLAILIVTLAFILKTQQEEPDLWVLQKYGNSVALVSNGEVVEVFEHIVTDTLPENDIRQLEYGIVFHTKDEALTAIEDYDG